MLTKFGVKACHRALGPSSLNLSNWVIYKDASQMLTEAFATVLSGYQLPIHEVCELGPLGKADTETKIGVPNFYSFANNRFGITVSNEDGKVFLVSVLHC